MFRKLQVILGWMAVLSVTLLLGACGRSEKKEESSGSSSSTTNNAPLSLLSGTTPTSTVTNFPVRGVGTLQIPVPTTWRASAKYSPPDRIPGLTIFFSNEEGSSFAMEFTALFDPENRLALNARAACEKALEKARPRALETNLSVQDLTGPEFLGHYFSITDKTLVDRMPPVGEFKYMVQGTSKLSQLVISFKIFSNNPKGDDRQKGLEMLRNIRFVRQ